ncbi:T9SS type A sorting domain-containing protein [Flavobacterium sp.]|jgi:hypothetical protein|uniref:T9SS type A sorting domain-containing protein n=1 Tax=Flavobacterium sp. TaxID=239 RepID=UPI0037BEEE54
MRKITFTIMTLLLANALQAQLTSAAPYCTPVYPTNATYNMMQDFKIGGAVIQSFGPMGSYHNVINTFKYYSTTILPTLAKGSGYSFTLDFFNVNDVEPNYFAVWIDFNNNNSFENSEIVMQNNNTINADLPTYGGGVTPVTKTITIPTTATTGVTRMRIKRATNDANVYGAYSSTFTLPSCSSTSQAAYGCMYDFNVTIGPSLSNSSFEKELFKLFPNPVSNTLFIKELNNNLISKIKVFNQFGQEIKLVNTDFKNGINVSELSNGIYFVQISSENNSENSILKFIKI